VVTFHTQPTTDRQSHCPPLDARAAHGGPTLSVPVPVADVLVVEAVAVAVAVAGQLQVQAGGQ